MKRVMVTMGLCLGMLGCGAGDKVPAADDFSELRGLDEKSDQFQAAFRTMGTIAYGETKSTRSALSVRLAYKFTGNPGDKVTASVTAPTADPVAWILDAGMNILAYNDDADSSTLASKLEATLAGAAGDTYYVVFRDYYQRKNRKFTVSLSGVRDFYACSVDADCVRILNGACCGRPEWIAVNAAMQTAYDDAHQCSPLLKCAVAPPLENGSVAQCINDRCEAVLPADIACGGFTLNPHRCPRGFVCEEPGNDAPGSCVKNQMCGGIAGLGCPAGQECIEDLTDGCDPAWGGADCSGLCADLIDCRTTGCAAGQYCSPCRGGGYFCLANGSAC